MKTMCIVFKERIYKIWKQFTTPEHGFRCFILLCSKNEYTKSESNSQPDRQSVRECRHCVQRTNIQNLKAIHNARSFTEIFLKIVFKERIYKIWKQFTTSCTKSSASAELCSKNEYTKSESNSQPFLTWTPRHRHCVQRTNIQNLKAIHNRSAVFQ